MSDELVLETICTRPAGYLGYGLASVINFLIRRGSCWAAASSNRWLLFDVASDYARREALAVPGRAVEFTRARLGRPFGSRGRGLIGAGHNQSRGLLAHESTSGP